MDKKIYLNKIYYGKHIFCLGLLFSTTGIIIDRKWGKKNDVALKKQIAQNFFSSYEINNLELDHLEKNFFLPKYFREIDDVCNN